MVQRNFVEKKSMLAKKRIAVRGVIIAAIAFCLLFYPFVLLIFSPAMLMVVFPVLVFLPISAVLLLTFVGFGAIVVWAFFSRDLKRVLPLCSVLLLPAFAAAIFWVFFPTFAPFLVLLLFVPILAVLLSIFAGLGAIIVCAPLRRDLGRVLKLIKFTFEAIALSPFLLVAFFMPLPRILTFLVAGLVVAYLYWPGKKRGLFLGVLGPVLALELALLLTINLIIF